MLRCHLGHQRRLDHGRCHAVEQHTVLRQLLGRGLGESDDPGLGCRIGRDVLHAILAGHGGDIDDAPIAAFAHMRDGGAAAIEHAVQVNGDDLVPGLWRVLPRRHHRAVDAGIVDQDLYLAQARQRLGKRRLHRGQRRHIDRLAQHRLKAVSHAVPAVDSEVPDDHLGAGRMQALGDCQADATHATGHDCGLALQVLAHCSAPFSTEGISGKRRRSLTMNR
ncbi:hypothetical protein D3C76_760270 [compost metagenome]